MRDIYADDLRKIKATDWGRVHVEADRRPFFGAVGRKTARVRGEGVRRERGGCRDRLDF